MDTITRPLTEKEVSAMTGLAPGTLRYWRHTGEGPRSYRLGRSVRYDVQDVRDWIAEQKAATSRGGAA
ncbi:helix-turn-helix transcriptional regulator [Brachybacterium paraconglomeratum]|uniref:helix-turn-helix transcriptional regulator n=1 Tax=Brachybacterium paraconglomeratum TaxID=173362 RepID=UPI003FD5D43D